LPSSTQKAYRFDDCLVDIAGFQVTKGGQTVALEPKSIRVLHFLVENRGRLVSKEELMQAVWGETFVSDNALTRVIAQLRKALGDRAKHARYIETVPTQGYRFVAPVEEIEEEVPLATVSVPPAVPPVSPPARFTIWHVLAGVVIAVALVAVWLWRAKQPDSAMAEHRGARPVPRQITSSTGLEVGPAFSSDGNSIAFAADRTGSFEIYVKPLTSAGRELQVTNDGMQNVQPTWSPDGRLIAYYSATKMGISVVPALGGFPRKLTGFGSEPAFSPDGKWIAFRSGGFTTLAMPDLAPPVGSRIWVVPVSGGEPRQLTAYQKPNGTHGSPSWSPDGRIVFAAYDGGRSNFWTVDVQGGAPVGIPASNTRQMRPVFSPDGNAIFASCLTAELTFGICKTDVSTGVTKEVVWTGLMAPRDLAISRAGTSLAYSLTLTTSNLWTMRLTPDGRPAGSPAPLTEDSSLRSTMPAISPDGRRVAYQVKLRGTMSDIYVMDGSASPPQQITHDPGAEYMPSWTPDGKALVFSSTKGGGNKLWRVSLADGSETVAVNTPLPHTMGRLSPDGKQAVFHRYEGIRLATYRVSLADGRVTRMTPESESIGYPTWSRDGKWIIGERVVGEGTEVGVIPAEGGSYRALTRTPGQNWPYSSSPDGKRVIMASLRDGVWNLWWVDLNGREQRLTSYRSLRTYVRYPDWSPTGERVVFEFGEAKGNIFIADLNRP
jgi:Tol biopolymer transport system component/DNA-binding winged helix-turn-helix (wHTH) protein